MFVNIRVAEDAETVAREIGVPIARGASFRVPFPVRARVGVVEPAPEAPAPLAPAALLRHVFEHLPRYAGGEPCADQAGLQRRLAAIPPKPSRRPPLEDWNGEATRLDELAWLHYQRDALALATPELTADFAIYPHDEVGQRLDAEHEAKIARAREERERAEREERERAAPDLRTAEERGHVDVWLPKEAFTRDERGSLYAGGERVHHALRVSAARAVVEDDEGYTFSFDVARLRGLLPAEGPLPAPFYGQILPRSHVFEGVSRARLAAKVIEIRDERVSAWFGLRRLPSTEIDASTLRDLRTPEGARAAELLREYAAELLDELTSPEGHARARAERLFVQSGVRGLRVHPDVVFAIYERAVPATLVPGVPQKRSSFFREDGDRLVRVPDAEVRRIPVGETMAGRPYRVIGRMLSTESANQTNMHPSPKGGDQVEWLVEVVTEEPGPAKEQRPLSRARFVELVNEALAGRKPWVGIDEFFTPPEPSWVDRWRRKIFGDPWAEEILAYADGRTQFSYEDVFEALDLGHKPTNDDYRRVRSTLERAGFVHRQLAAPDGTRPKLWVRA